MTHHTCKGRCFRGEYYNPALDNELGFIPPWDAPCMFPNAPGKAPNKQFINSAWEPQKEANPAKFATTHNNSTSIRGFDDLVDKVNKLQNIYDDNFATQSMRIGKLESDVNINNKVRIAQWEQFDMRLSICEKDISLSTVPAHFSIIDDRLDKIEARLLILTAYQDQNSQNIERLHSQLECLIIQFNFLHKKKE